MFTEEVLVEEGIGNGRARGVDGLGLNRQGRDLFQHDGIVSGFGWRFSPGERSVPGKRDRRHGNRIQRLRSEPPHDRETGIQFVALENFVVGKGFRHRHRAMEAIRMCCAGVRDLARRMRSGGCRAEVAANAAGAIRGAEHQVRGAQHRAVPRRFQIGVETGSSIHFARTPRFRADSAIRRSSGSTSPRRIASDSR